MPNTAKVIFAWDKKILSFSKNSKCRRDEIQYKQEIYKMTTLFVVNVLGERFVIVLVQKM